MRAVVAFCLILAVAGLNTRYLDVPLEGNLRRLAAASSTCPNNQVATTTHGKCYRTCANKNPSCLTRRDDGHHAIEGCTCPDNLYLDTPGATGDMGSCIEETECVKAGNGCDAADLLHTDSTWVGELAGKNEQTCQLSACHVTADKHMMISYNLHETCADKKPYIYHTKIDNGQGSTMHKVVIEPTLLTHEDPNQPGGSSNMHKWECYSDDSCCFCQCDGMGTESPACADNTETETPTPAPTPSNVLEAWISRFEHSHDGSLTYDVTRRLVTSDNIDPKVDHELADGTGFNKPSGKTDEYGTVDSYHNNPKDTCGESGKHEYSTRFKLYYDQQEASWPTSGCHRDNTDMITEDVDSGADLDLRGAQILDRFAQREDKRGKAADGIKKIVVEMEAWEDDSTHSVSYGGPGRASDETLGTSIDEGETVASWSPDQRCVYNRWDGWSDWKNDDDCHVWERYEIQPEWDGQWHVVARGNEHHKVYVTYRATPGTFDGAGSPAPNAGNGAHPFGESGTPAPPTPAPAP